MLQQNVTHAFVNVYYYSTKIYACNSMHTLVWHLTMFRGKKRER